MLKRLSHDDRGVAAVEFALIAPVLVATYLGLTQVSMGFLAERRAAHVAAVVADLVAQPAQITTSQVDDIFNIADPIMRPFPTGAAMTVRVSKVQDVSGTPRVKWSRGHNIAALPVDSVPSEIQPGLLAAGEIKILTEVTYTYTSPVGDILPTTVTFHETSRTSPRKGDVLLN